MITSHPNVYYDAKEFRYVFSPLDGGTALPMISALRMVKRTNTTWPEFAKFLGLKNSNEAFRAVYGSSSYANIKLRDKVRLLYVVDVGANKAYLYDKDHAPTVVLPTRQVPTLYCGDDTVQTVTERVSTRVTSRTRIEYDDENKKMSLIIAPTGGYIGVPKAISSDVDKPLVFADVTIGALNKILDTLLFTGMQITEGGKLNIRLIDPETKKEVATDITIKVVKNTTIPLPDIQLPENPQLTLGKFTEVKNITVTEDQNRFVRVIVTPFNASMITASLLKPIPSRGIYDISGTPEYVNKCLSSLAILAKDKTAQLGIKVRCENVEKLKYLKFTYAEGGAPTPTPPVTNPTLTLNPNKVDGVPGTEKAISAKFAGATGEFEVSIKPENCQVKGFKSKPDATNTEHKFKGNLDAINGELAGLKVVVGNATGKVTLTYPGGSQVINVTVTPSATPTLKANDLTGATGAEVNLGAALSTEGVYADQSVTVTATECTIKGLADTDITTGKNTVLKGKVAEINKKLGAAKVVIGSKAGNVKFDWSGQTKTIKVNLAAAG